MVRYFIGQQATQAANYPFEFHKSGRSAKERNRRSQAVGARIGQAGNGCEYWKRASEVPWRTFDVSTRRQCTAKERKRYGLEYVSDSTQSNVGHVSSDAWDAVPVGVLDGHESLKRDYCQVLETEVQAQCCLGMYNMVE